MHAAQSRVPSAPANQAPSPNAQFPGVPYGPQFPLPPFERQFSPIPEVKQFPPPKPPATLWTRQPEHFTVDTKTSAPRVVCGMTVIPGNADLDRKILRELPPDAPKGVITVVSPQCQAEVAAVEPQLPPR